MPGNACISEKEKKKMNVPVLLNRIAFDIVKGKKAQAEKHLLLAWKYQNQMSAAELSVLYAHREKVYGRPLAFDHDEKADFYENKILARQGV